MEFAINNIFEKSLFAGGLIIVGYSGCDVSIMSVLEKNNANKDFLPNGLIWLKHKNSELPIRTIRLMENNCNVNENSGIVEIDSFDEFMYRCYQICEGNNPIINENWHDFRVKSLPINFSSKKEDYFIKLNSFESIFYPTPVSFDTDIVSWKDLREAVGEIQIITALYAKKIYCFGPLETIKDVFKNHILSDIKHEVVPEKYLYLNESFYAGMLYELIGKSLLCKSDIKKFGKNKFYDSSKHEQIEKNGCKYVGYDGIEIFLDFIQGKYNLLILITIFITDLNGNAVSKEERKYLTNKKMSNIYNQNYDDKIKYWNRLLRKKDAPVIEFNYDGFSIEFNHVCISYGKIPISSNFPQRMAYQLDEPKMVFNLNNQNAIGINQLKGISNYGPIDFSYAKQDQIRHSIILSIIVPKEDLVKIINHLAKLNNGNKVNTDDGFTPIYNGFEKIYRQSLDIPQLGDMKRCLIYDSSLINTREDLVNILKSKIDFVSINNLETNILVIYIPKNFEPFRMGNPGEDFNLHDAIKLYAIDKRIRVQFIEEKSINAYEPCKVMWALSTSIYAKQGGVLWRPETLNTDTAFVGISYAYSEEKGISVGCSQLFDETGTGLRLLLRKIRDPLIIKNNPFMKSDEARQMMSTLREQYYLSSPTAKLSRIVIHKTTFFTDEEMKGFTQALEGIEDIELLQIQEFTPWRGIRFKGINFYDGVNGFPLKRGTIIQLSNNQFLLWTHGSVINKELFDGKDYNYYKGSRGIPRPLMIKRFYGKATGDVITNEIMMLTKMNWNSGDSLYKNLPVTIDFAKVLSRMSKQNEALYDQLYDFRYFM